jgi:hypothetical protein
MSCMQWPCLNWRHASPPDQTRIFGRRPAEARVFHDVEGEMWIDENNKD